VHKKKVSKENAPNATARYAGSLSLRRRFGAAKKLALAGFGHFCGKAPEPPTALRRWHMGVKVKILKPETCFSPYT
jgi:hypothetical protein